MAKFGVYFAVFGTAYAEIEAPSAEAARAVAEAQYEGGDLCLCHECAGKLSDPTYGEVADIVEHGAEKSEGEAERDTDGGVAAEVSRTLKRNANAAPRMSEM